jgi:UDP-2,4-diacetamido-2,4,6-trideoxy-beta-L-altropyranose hydrolase
LVVDHYALDEYWESRLRPFCRHLVVIDDLADRRHDCDLLLDQNLGRLPSDYLGRVPEACTLLVGPRYALLRPEFAMLRGYSLKRRSQPGLRNLLITMGGVDQSNVTCQVLEMLKQCAMPEEVRISVVMGPQAPWLAQVRECAQSMPWTTNVLVNISDMAQCMADSDLVIGAAGSTSWERCCLGVPTLMVVLAENQWPSARALQAAQAVELLGDAEVVFRMPYALDRLIAEGASQRMAQAAADVTDGQGVGRVLASLIRLLPDE